MEEEYEPEKYLEGELHALPCKILKKLCKLMETAICKIKCEGFFGTGFFCNIFYNDWDYIKVLITNYHILNEKYIMGNKVINFSINDEAKTFEIKIDESRIFYSNKQYDVVFIEIRNNDGLNKESFLEIDNNIFKENNKNNFI